MEFNNQGNEIHVRNFRKNLNPPFLITQLETLMIFGPRNHAQILVDIVFVLAGQFAAASNHFVAVAAVLHELFGPARTGITGSKFEVPNLSRKILQLLKSARLGPSSD